MGILNLSDDEKILAAKAEDYIRRAKDKGVAAFTDFLSDREQAVVMQVAAQMSASENTVVFGGYSDAERAVVGFFPDYCLYMERKELLSDFPLSVLCIKCSGFREHTHRDFLGSFMGLGIERSVIGDIIPDEKGYSATVFVLSKISGYICENLRLVGRDGVKVFPRDFEGLHIAKRKFADISGTCASLRIDALISEILNVSREKASTLILDGSVSINHSELSDKSKTVAQGDIITVRGFGKFRVFEIGDINRKGRTRFTVQKYI